MKPNNPRLTQINQAIKMAQESLKHLERVRDEGRFLDDAAYERSVTRIAHLEEEIAQLTMLKHTRFLTGDPVQHAALKALSLASESGRKVSAQLKGMS